MRTGLLVTALAASAATGAVIGYREATRVQVINAPEWQAVYRRSFHSHLFRLYEEAIEDQEARVNACATARRRTINASGLRALGGGDPDNGYYVRPLRKLYLRLYNARHSPARGSEAGESGLIAFVRTKER